MLNKFIITELKVHESTYLTLSLNLNVNGQLQHKLYEEKPIKPPSLHINNT